LDAEPLLAGAALIVNRADERRWKRRSRNRGGNDRKYRD